MLLIFITCLAGSLMATVAHSQKLASDATTSAAARFPSGWWWPERTESETSSQLAISMAEVSQFRASNSLGSSPAQPNIDQQTEPVETSIASLPHFGLTEGSVAEPRFSTDRVPLPPASSLALVQSDYSTWESSLAESRTLTEVHGAPVYPLLQVNIAGWQLPVTIYTSSLRGQRCTVTDDVTNQCRVPDSLFEGRSEIIAAAISADQLLGPGRCTR
jgi:hypothetical protein